MRSKTQEDVNNFFNYNNNPSEVNNQINDAPKTIIEEKPNDNVDNQNVNKTETNKEKIIKAGKNILLTIKL